MNISLNFAVDRNRDRKIQPEETVSFAQLKVRDGNGDGVLKGQELRDLYFQYGQDTWLEAGQPHRLKVEQATHLVQLRSIGLEPPRIDMHVDVTF